MPLEINEIGIHIRVPDGSEPPPAAGGAPSGGDDCGDVDHARVVEDCVRRVLQVLAARTER
jgi:hypothetical protein